MGSGGVLLSFIEFYGDLSSLYGLLPSLDTVLSSLDAVSLSFEGVLLSLYQGFPRANLIQFTGPN